LLLVPYEKVRPHHGFVLVKKYLCHAKKTSDIISCFRWIANLSL
jgi:hypothetical protein